MHETLTKWEGKGVLEVKSHSLSSLTRSLVETDAECFGCPAPGLEIADSMSQLRREGPGPLPGLSASVP
jgi:hypothetical protein